MKLNWFVHAAVSATLFLTACSKISEQQKIQSDSEDAKLTEEITGIRKTRTLKVTDSRGQPVAGAQVLIGDGLNQPFASNFVTTDSNGAFQAPNAWSSFQVVTIAAPGFVRASYFDQLPQGQTFQLRAAPAPAQYELNGKGVGFQTRDGDNMIDFALMLPIIHRQDLLAFNIGMLISPQSDVVDVYGNKISLPSNVSLPRQRENYSIVPVTLDKSKYRLYFDALGVQRVVTLRGQFPFKQVVSEMQNSRPFLDLINYFSLKGGSLKEANITQNSQTLDLPVNELVFDRAQEFQTPAFQNDEFVLAAALSPYQGEYMPTDFKNVPANANFRLNVAAGETPQLLVALKKKAESNSPSVGRISAALVPFVAGVRPTVLPLIENPQVVSLNEIRSQAPAAPSNVKPMMTYLLLSSVSKQGTGVEAVETTTPLWEVYTKDWKDDVRLPQWPDERLEAGAKRWEISFMGSQNPVNKGIDFGPRILETVTHATHSATDF